MPLTPMDILHREFKRSLRGFSRQQVSEFQREVAHELGALLDENSSLKEQVKTLQDKLSYYERIEETMQNALLLAEKAAEQAKRTAEQQAELIVSEAQARAKQILDEALRKASEIQSQIADLMRERDRLEIELRALLQSILDVLDRKQQEWQQREPIEPAHPAEPPIRLAAQPSSETEEVKSHPA